MTNAYGGFSLEIKPKEPEFNMQIQDTNLEKLAKGKTFLKLSKTRIYSDVNGL